MVPLKGDAYNLLGDHFHPILATLAPLYWIWDDARVLLLAQAALVAASIPVIAGLFRRHFKGVLPILLTVCYALSWPIQRMIDFDFHEVAFAIPLLAVALDGLDRRDDRRLIGAGLLLLLVREDMGMVLAVIGLVRLLQPGRRWVGGMLSVVGVVTFVFVTRVVIPHFASNGQFAYWSYDALGPDALSSIKFIVMHPLKTLEIFVTPLVKAKTLVYLFGPLLCLPLLSPIVLASLPLLAGRFLSSRSNLWTTDFHYSAPIMVILVFASVDAIGRIGRWWGGRTQHAVAIALAVAMTATPVVDLAIQGGNYPFIRLAWPAWRIEPHMRDQRAVTQWLPPDTCVEADDRIAVHLTHRNRVTLPTLSKREADFVVLDASQEDPGFQLPTPQELERRVAAEGYQLVLVRGELTVWQRPGYSGPSSACSPDAP